MVRESIACPGKSRQRLAGKALQPGNDAGCVDVRAGRIGMHDISRKERPYLILTLQIVVIGDEARGIYEEHLLGE